MISISTTTANTSGAVVLNTDDDGFKNNTARLSRVATLDGSAVITHNGVSDSDRTFSVKNYKITDSAASVLWDIFTDETSVLVCTSDGLFLGAIQSMKIKDNYLTMTIYIESKESA